MQRPHVAPQFGLRVFDECKDLSWKQRSFFVSLGAAARFPAPVGEQNLLDISFKRAFGGLTSHLFLSVP